MTRAIITKFENTNTVIAQAENLSNSSLKTDDRSSGLVQTLKQFGNNDELTDEQVMIRKNMGIIHDPA